jgi:membrane-associated protease RseP (regulator of RpoE activity)
MTDAPRPAPFHKRHRRTISVGLSVVGLALLALAIYFSLGTARGLAQASDAISRLTWWHIAIALGVPLVNFFLTSLIFWLLTARGLPAERIEGLRIGADDYLSKPFEPEELLLRIASILKRAVPEAPVEEIKLSGMVFHVARGELRKDGRIVRLTESEMQLLSILAQRAGAVISRRDLAVLTAAGVERSVDVQVTRLRRKIERDPREPVHLQTVRGVGYRLTGD